MQRATAAKRLALSIFVLLLLPQKGKSDEGANLMFDGGGEGANSTKGQDSAWYPAFRPAQGVRLWIDHENVWSGRSCLAISNELNESHPASNNWAQKLTHIPAEKTVRLSAYIKVQDADRVNVCVQCWGSRAEKLIGFTSTPVHKGTHDWTFTQSPELVVPAETERLIVRAALTGKGKAFFDNISLQVVDGTTPGESNFKNIVRGGIKRTISITRDALVLSYMPQWRHGNVDNIAIGNNDGGARTLMCWESPTEVELAQPGLQFWLMLYVRNSHLQGEAPLLQVHEVEEPWSEIIDWTQQPKFRLQPAIETSLSPGEGWKAINVTPLIRSRTGTQSAIHGIVLRFKNEDRQLKLNNWSSYQFASREGIGRWEKCRPVLLVVDPNKEPD